ncbi:MAG TPA: DoxX family protein [Asanoa sp.]|nr:DoxX family protein [Asanoa sp.]
MFIAAAILSVLLALAFAFVGASKVFTAADKMLAGLGRLGLSVRLIRLIGALEMLGAAGLVIGLWIGPLGIAAAIGLALLMIGAAIYHIRARDTAKQTMSPLIMLVLSATVVALRAASL